MAINRIFGVRSAFGNHSRTSQAQRQPRERGRDPQGGGVGGALFEGTQALGGEPVDRWTGWAFGMASAGETRANIEGREGT